MQSSFIDLGKAAGDGRTKVIRALSWDIDQPPDTKLELRSRSGNTLGEQYTFYDRAGNLTTEESWISKPKVLRGPIDTTVVTGADWDEWSNFYQVSGEPFKSKSPRRFIQLEMILSTADPQVAPEVASLSIEFEGALIQGALGTISPRNARTNADTRFRYTLFPEADTGDSSFDILRFTLPGPLSTEEVELTIDGVSTVPASISAQEDSLFIALPQKIIGDSVQVSFTARVLQNAAVFTLDLGNGQRPGIWQSVEPATRRSNVVLLPELPRSGQLIDDLRVEPALFTPNGDGANEQLAISFVVLKLTAANAEVKIHDLAGRFITRLAATETDGRLTFPWSGHDAQGALVPPGTYLCRIDLGADHGEDLRLRAIAVAY
jgi:hypothetical protein